MHRWAVFLLAVIACSHLVFSVEAGRHITSVNKVDNSALMHKEDHHQPAAPSNIPKAAAHNSGSSGKKEVLPPPLPDSVAGYKDAFRPTTPGNSPGAGHSFAGNDDKHSTAGAAADDFRRTNPGHSPGVGHVFQTKNSEPNA